MGHVSATLTVTENMTLTTFQSALALGGGCFLLGGIVLPPVFQLGYWYMTLWGEQ